MHAHLARTDVKMSSVRNSSSTTASRSTRQNGHVSPDKIRRQGITTFAIASDICDDQKFIMFKRALRVDQRTAYMHFCRFINYVAKNCAFTGQIDIAKAEVIAEFCWYDSDAEQFINALKTAGFIHQDGTVNDWFDWQPLAKFILKQHANGKKGGRPSSESGLTQPEPKYNTNGVWVNPDNENNNPSAENRNPVNVDVGVDVNANNLSSNYSLGGGDNPPPPPTYCDAVIQVLHRIGQRTGIDAYANISALSWLPDLRKHGLDLGFECIYRQALKFERYMIDQFESGKFTKQKQHLPRVKFLTTWLGRVYDNEKTTGDYDEFPSPQADFQV